MNYFLGLLSGFLLGAVATTIVTTIAYPNPSNNGFSLGPLLIYILPVWSAFISIPAYVVSMWIRPYRSTKPDEKRQPASGAYISASITLLAAIAFWVFFRNKR